MSPSWMRRIASMLAWASSWYARSRWSVACGMSSQIFTGPRRVSATTVRLPFGRIHVLLADSGVTPWPRGTRVDCRRNRSVERWPNKTRHGKLAVQVWLGADLL